ncbi:protein kinase, partial [Dolichospermum sp. ST_sed3]|nr:protein kinase [Dolichospermum sp. ST_sed3]
MNANKRSYWVNMDLEKEPLLPPDDPSEDDTEHGLSEIEIVDTIIKALHDASLRCINRDELIKIISKLHNNQQRAFTSNDFIVLKKYEDYSENEERKSKQCKYDYGVFKHRHMNLIFRVDSTDDQVDNENKIAQILLKKYNNNYKNVLQMGIVLPVYTHIQHSSKSPLFLFPLYYSIQPYVDGITLDCWVENNKYKRNFIEIVYDLFIQLCAIIKELHELDCVHGDLKPGNVLVVSNVKTSQNCLYLIDFGLSGKHLKTRHASGGTLPYCAPETQNTCAL